ncbi:conjugal transfer protein TraV [Skermanella stibiiresistens SB22]|uniref:Conjugal transfer protein TraV n=1 Tax=Skermanella stibiiresistens SB22 TaxID=1385369 RepID=W9GQZ2_9PROT|nr:type IV conjugative transfer system lipoprotein TraV [Skermanella stibiiresistens]EWY36154.1 conjugal transfer protein TraV [Skermanella stibiiresistens SB22]
MRILLLATLALSGCTFIGDAEYACKGMPEGVACRSAREVYDLTEHRQSLESRQEERETPKPPHAGGAPHVQPAVMVPMAPTPVVSDGRVPIRTPANVMRIWIGPWESSNGDLHVPGLIFTEIEPRRWQLGLPPAEEAAVLRPLETRAAP